MKRRLQKSGELFYLSLPAKWVKSNSLRKGDELNCEFNNNELLIKTDETIKDKKLNLEVAKTSPLALTHLVLGSFESGATEVNIKLANKLSKDELKLLKNQLIDRYNLNMVEISEDKVRLSLFFQNPDLSETIKALFNTILNLARSVLINDEDLIKLHEKQAQFFRFTTKRLVKINHENPSYTLIAEHLGFISRALGQNYQFKGTTLFYEKLVSILQKIIKDHLDINKLSALYDESLKLKELSTINKVRHFDLTRIYHSILLIIRELMKLSINQKIV